MRFTYSSPSGIFWTKKPYFGTLHHYAFFAWNIWSNINLQTIGVALTHLHPPFLVSSPRNMTFLLNIIKSEVTFALKRALSHHQVILFYQDMLILVILHQHFDWIVVWLRHWSALYCILIFQGVSSRSRAAWHFFSVTVTLSNNCVRMSSIKRPKLDWSDIQKWARLLVSVFWAWKIFLISYLYSQILSKVAEYLRFILNLNSSTYSNFSNSRSHINVRRPT